MKGSAPIVLALITTFGLFFCIFYMLKWGFPEQIKDQLSVFTQLLGTIWTLQMNFFFGSTAASKDKDATISDIAKMPINPPVATDIPAKDVTVAAEGDVTINKEKKPNA